MFLFKGVYAHCTSITKKTFGTTALGIRIIFSSFPLVSHLILVSMRVRSRRELSFNNHLRNLKRTKNAIPNYIIESTKIEQLKSCKLV